MKLSERKRAKEDSVDPIADELESYRLTNECFADPDGVPTPLDPSAGSHEAHLEIVWILPLWKPPWKRSR